MKILAIRGCNIASLAGDFEVDFTAEPLRSAGIFAIAGATGAGKSTLLDVMTLALYDDTPRLKSATNAEGQSEETTVSDTRNLMTRGTGEARAEVDFLATTGERYRATWEVHRARNKSDGKLQNVSMKLINLDTDTEVKGKKTDTLRAIAELVGLQYEQFTRTVVLAQGEFSKFIKSKEADRASILEKLTGTQIYSVISKQIFDRADKVGKELDVLKAQMKGREPLPEEKVAELREAESMLDKEIKQAGEGLEQLKQLMKWFDEVDKRQRALVDTQTALSQLVADEEAMAPRYDLAAAWRQAKPTLNLLAQQADLNGKLAANAESAAGTERLLADILAKQKALTEQDAALGKEKELFEAGTEAFNTLVERANRLTSDIADATKLLDEHKKAADAASTILQNASAAKLQAGQKIDSARREQEEAESWIAGNEGRRAVAKNKDLIVYQLSEASGLRNSIEKDDADMARRNSELQQYNTVKADAEEKRKGAECEREKLAEAIDALSQQLDGTDLEALRNELTARSEHRSTLERLLPLAVQADRLQKARRDGEALLGQLEAEIERLKREQASATQARLVADGRKQEAQAQHERVKLMAAESVATLRTTLVEGEACPVCGATAHPFAKERDDIFAQLLTDAKRAFDQASASFEACNRQVVDIEKLLATHETSAKTTRKDLEQRIAPELDEIGRSWSKIAQSAFYSLADCALTIESLNRDTGVADKACKELDARIKQLDAASRELAAKTKSLGEAKEAVLTLDGKINESSLRIAAAVNAINDIRTRVADNSKQIDNLLDGINRYFNASTWQDNWRNAPDSFVRQIEKFADDWASKEKLIADKKELLVLLESQQREAAGEEQRAAQALADASRLHEEVAARIQASRMELTALTGGQTVEALKLARKQQADNLNNSLTKLAARLKELAQQEGELRGGLKALGEAKEALGKELTAAGKRLTSEMALLGIDEARLAELSLVAEADVAAIDEAKQRANERGIALRTQIKAAEKELADLAALRPAEIERDEAERLQQEHTASITELQHRYDDVRGQLAVNNKNIRDTAALKMRVDAKQGEVDNWNTLNSLLGSRDGAKFQKIAQSYTLDLLLLSANEQLRSIAPRYLLERIPDSLSLRVVDRDMCDEVRSVFSLSGGETFLVSLALALGLASLSSHNMNIESLFIDEGFGSLDETTLMVTMDALESLHMQGRKVGVISHVAEMTERIAAQIRIKKLQSGVSKIEIKG